MPTERMKVNGLRVAYNRSGRGFPALLLHGFPRTRRVWDALTPLLADRLSVVAVDRRGYGESERPADPATCNPRQHAADALELMGSVGIDRFLVVGHDLGAPVARHLAAAHPDRVAGAVIMDATPDGAGLGRRPDPTGRSWYLDFFRQRGVAEAIVGRDPALFFGLFLDRHAHLSAEERQRYLDAYCQKGSVEAVLADYRALLEEEPAYWDAEAAAGRRMDTPLCVFWAERGPVGALPVLEAWRRVASDVRGASIADTAHYIQEERPDETARRILAFAEELGLT